MNNYNCIGIRFLSIVYKIIFCCVAFFTLCSFQYFSVEKEIPINPPKKVEITPETRLKTHVEQVKKLITNSPKYNSKIAFFIDMKIPSGKNRFFVYDLENDKVIDQGLVAHGYGSETAIPGELMFSNIKNSYTTSLGKYYIGENYKGVFGKSYKMFGLEKTNDKAYERKIVLHKHIRVPYSEQDFPICTSLGCPMINEVFFYRIENILDKSEKNIVMDIYY